MSTDKQIYSTANQKDAIAAYAAAHGFEIVKTYADEGKSGLRLKGREALQEMLADVLGRSPGYQAILVYDVSRWGRFQDTDESAHYEFICRKAGVKIHYCAEMFANDGSLASAVMKNLRRAMAGEFSRDLSEKTWAGQARLAKLGYKMGGMAGYGLRRLLVDADGNAKQVLEEGQHKSITTDRIILVPGPRQEVRVVRRIFHLAEQGLNYQQIADMLNQDGIPGPKGNPWINGTIREMVHAERYIGANIYNKRSIKLGSAWTNNPEHEWVRRDDAFEPLVSAKTFAAIQTQPRYRRPTYTDAYLLDHLHGLLATHGYLTMDIITAASPPSQRAYKSRFGNLRNAYARVGYDPAMRDPFGPSGAAVDAFVDEVEHALREMHHRVTRAKLSKLLTVDARTILAPRLYGVHDDGLWRLKFSSAVDTDFILAGLLRGGEREAMYLLPAKKFSKSYTIKFNGSRDGLATFKLWSFDYLPEMIDILSR